MSDNGFPRSIRTDLFTPAETAIRTALIAVEAVGADPLLTDAVILLGDAQKKVAEWVDREIAAGRMAMPKPPCKHPFGRNKEGWCFECGDHPHV